MTDFGYEDLKRNRGFFASLNLAFRIAKGSLRLLRLYPIIVLPLLPVFAMVLGVLVGLFFISNLLPALMVIYAVAFALMFSFAITSNMLLQIHSGKKPSITEAIGASSTVRMIPRVLLLSAIWYVLVTILVIIETAIRTVLDRISGDLADAVISFIFGTIADVLRMSGFMLIAIMTFEDVSLKKAFGQLKAVVRDNPIVAVGGLTLTKIVSFLIFVVLYALSEILAGTAPGIFSLLLLAAAMGLGWVLAIYLEQLFVTGLYLYSTAPESPLVSIILGDVIDYELPPLPKPGPLEQPVP